MHSRPPWLALLLVAASLGACGDANSASGGQVIDAHVVEVTGSGVLSGPSTVDQPFQKLVIQLDGGLYRGERANVEWRGRGALNAAGLLSPGDRVLVTETRDGQARTYTIHETVRLPSLLPFLVLFAVALLLVGLAQGLAALAGLVASGSVLLLVVVPSIGRGSDPLVAVLIGSAVVLTLTVVVVHGLNRKSLAALIGTYAGLAIVGVLAALAVGAAHLTGLNDEQAIFVILGSPVPIDASRLVLAGIVVGSLGALVDMSIGQASATFELTAADPTLRGRSLYASALNVGRDHIGSLVNTLVFAYLGGALPLVVFLSLGYVPLNVALNSEEIVGAILQALVASIGLILCVPATTLVAVWLADRRRAGR